MGKGSQKVVFRGYGSFSLLIWELAAQMCSVYENPMNGELETYAFYLKKKISLFFKIKSFLKNLSQQFILY